MISGQRKKMSRYWENHWNAPCKTADAQSQVGRTCKKRPVDAGIFVRTLDFVADKMHMDKDSRLLDLCCGNGMFALPFSRKIRHVTAVDFSAPLLSVLEKNIEKEKIQNIEIQHGDINCFTPDENKKFTHVILYFALQHFSESETIRLFEMVRHAFEAPCSAGGGVFYIGDIPDRARLWCFADTQEYRRMYFDSVRNGEPAIGTWFLKEDLLALAEYAGFRHAEIIEQPAWQINSRYRFDMRCVP
jgi:ubiquinone/menaquinone biosynthesis C-methylase UbiE